MKKKLIMSCLVHHFSHTNFGGSCSSVWSNAFAINRISYQDERGFLRAEMAKRNEAKNDNDDCGWCCLMDSSQVISRTKSTNYIFCQNYVRWAILNKLSARCMYFYLKKMGHPRPLLSYILGLFKQTLQFLHQYMWRNVQPVSGTRIQTHNLLDASLLP